MPLRLLGTDSSIEVGEDLWSDPQGKRKVQTFRDKVHLATVNGVAREESMTFRSKTMVIYRNSRRVKNQPLGPTNEWWNPMAEILPGAREIEFILLRRMGSFSVSESVSRVTNCVSTGTGLNHATNSFSTLICGHLNRAGIIKKKISMNRKK